MFAVLYFLIQSFPQNSVYVTLDSFLFLQQDYVITFLYLWDLCVLWLQEWDSKCCLCTVWYSSKMDESHYTEELHLQRVSALYRLCCRRSKKAFDDRKVLLCKTYAADLYALHQIDISSDTVSKHSDTLCRPCYMCLMRLKRSKVPSYFTLQAAKEDTDESSDIWCELSSLKSADQCSVCAKFFSQIRGGRPTKPKRQLISHI